MKILMVENHARFARLATQQFLAAHDVTIVASLVAARAEYSANRFDAVLLDYDLDDGKGDVPAREISSSTPRPRIVAISSHENGDAALRATTTDAVCDKIRFSLLLKS